MFDSKMPMPSKSPSKAPPSAEAAPVEMEDPNYEMEESKDMQEMLQAVSDDVLLAEVKKRGIKMDSAEAGVAAAEPPMPA